MIMKKNVLIFAFAFILMLPCAVLLMACGQPKETEIKATINGVSITESNNSVIIDYGDYQSFNEIPWDNFISVKLLYNNNTQKDLKFGNNGYAISGFTENLNANEEGYELTISYNNLNTIKFKLIVNKLTIDMANVYWDYESTNPFVYDGTLKSVKIVGLPKNFTVTYSNNSEINAGNYTASAKIDYDSNNYKLINNSIPLSCNWEILKAQNVITGEILLNDWSYGEQPNVPTGLTAQNGDVTFKYYVRNSNMEYEEISAPTVLTNSGTYYVVGSSSEGKNWVSQTTNYKEFKITPISLINPTLNENSFIVSGSSITPTIQNMPDDLLVEVTGDKSATQTGSYSITIALKDKVNYKWQNANDLQSYTYDVILNWEIIDNPFQTIKINNETLQPQDFANINELKINNIWQVELSSDYSFSYEHKYKNKETGEIKVETVENVFSATVTAFDDYFKFLVFSDGELIYSKTLNVNKDIIEKVIINSDEITFDEFVANPILDYGSEISIIFKSEYANDFSLSISNSHLVVSSDTIYIYNESFVYYEIDYICNYDFLTNIKIDNVNITINELRELSTVSYGSTIEFDVNEKYSDLVNVYLNINSNEELLTGSKSIVFDKFDNFRFSFRLKENGSYIFEIDLRPILFDSISINNKEIPLNSINYSYEMDMNENAFEISIDEKYLNDYQIFYETNKNYNLVKLTSATLSLTIDEIGDCLYLIIKTEDSTLTALYITFLSFNPIKSVNAQIVNYYNGTDNNPLYIHDNKADLTINSGVIKGLVFEFKNGYEACTYKIFNEEGNELQNFSVIKSGIYTFKIYLDEEIYSFNLNLNYYFYNLFSDLRYIGSNDIPTLVTNKSDLELSLDDTEYFTNQRVTFNNKNSINLNLGQNLVNVVYTFAVNQINYSYAFSMFVEYTSEYPNDYVDSIYINYEDIYNNNDTILFDSNLMYSTSSALMGDLIRVTTDNIIINTKNNYSVVSKSIQVSSDKTQCYLEYTIDVFGEQKTFRAFIGTNGTISNSTEIELKYGDVIQTSQDVTDLIVNNTFEIEKVNVEGKIEIILKDDSARIETYYGNELISKNYNILTINKTGNYYIKITSSDNTATRTITVIVNEYEALLFEVYYEGNRLYLSNGDNGPVGNVKILYDEVNENIMFLGYFGDKNPDDISSVTLSGNSIYKNMLFYSDKTTPITDLSNLVLDLMLDTNNIIPNVGGAQVEYVLIYMIMETQLYPVYFVFANPTYPMSFSFDVNDDNVIDENDTSVQLNVNLNDIRRGIVDIGDFIYKKTSVEIELTRAQLGMKETEKSVVATIKWNKTFTDLSYKFSTEELTGSDISGLIGPSEEDTKITLNFEEQENGYLVATIYVCSEGATKETISDYLVPVNFILID